MSFLSIDTSLFLTNMFVLFIFTYRALLLFLTLTWRIIFICSGRSSFRLWLRLRLNGLRPGYFFAIYYIISLLDWNTRSCWLNLTFWNTHVFYIYRYALVIICIFNFRGHFYPITISNVDYPLMTFLNL